MQIITTNKPLGKTNSDLISIFLFSDIDPKVQLKNLPKKNKQQILNIIKKTKFKFKNNKKILLNSPAKLKTDWLLLIGLGDQSEQTLNINIDHIRQASALALQQGNELNIKQIELNLANLKPLFKSTNLSRAVNYGALLGAYQFNKYKKSKEKTKPTIKKIILSGIVKTNSQKIKEIQNICAGVNLARNLVNEPAVKMKPKDLVDTAQNIEQKSNQIKLTILNKKQLKKKKFGGILAVSQGSDQAPYLIHLKYQPSKKTKQKIALVGKGITFDSGGLSLKPAEYMGNMKTDMAGAAAVLGVFKILTKLSINVNLHGIIPVCENMPGAKALKPGDIITTYDGQTIEIQNTDAEGRLILADGLSYAKSLNPDQIIDIATLTGACIVALGDKVAGLMGNNQKIIDQLKKCAQQTGEKIWQLPLEKSYQKTIKSDIADLRNLSKMKSGGAITAGLFLQKFIDKTPWVHLDIAAPAWAEKPFNPYIPQGGTGFGVITLIEYLLNLKIK